jgi:endonuclease/exonuclease/phosphatase (EEP) superfamily protein YafD
VAVWLRFGVWVLSTVYLAGLAFVVGAVALGSARFGWPALLRELAPLLLLPLPLLLIPALVLGARIVALGVGGLLLLWVVIYGPYLIPKPAAPAAGPDLRVLSYNVGGSRGDAQADAVVAVVTALGPDAVCLVEGSDSSLAAIGAGLRPRYPEQIGTSGMLVLSRFPLLDETSTDWLDGAKGSLDVTLEVDHRLVTLSVVQLQRSESYPGLRAGPVRLLRTGHGFSTAARDAAVDQLVARLGRAPGTRVLVGDFNMTPSSHAYGALTEVLRDAFFEVGWGPGHTYPSSLRSVGLGLPLPLVRIDYIFHSADLVARRAWVGPNGGSDHLPILADLAFRDAPHEAGEERPAAPAS